jgi:hypothetical protein
MQQNIFSNTADHLKKNTGLAISKGGKETLTKNQLAFNKLTARIEKLHKEVEKKAIQLDTALNIYSTAIHPLRQQIAIEKRKLLDILWPVYKRREIPKNELGYLRAILKEYVEDILQSSSEEPDAELKKIFRELEGESYDAVKRREEDEMKAEVQDMFDGLDIDVDVNDFNLHDKSIAEKVAEAKQKMREKMEREQQQYQHQQQHKKQKKKTAKQVEKEKLQQAVDEMKQKNISTIYRQLAKLFHPDLEQDEEKRAEKEELMKQLTAAYEAKNLHVLLSLELKWIHKENDHLASLTEEKLAVYLKILSEQAQQLEKDKYQLIHKPQYSILIEDFGYPVIHQPLLFIKREEKVLEEVVNDLKNDVANSQSANALKHIKAMIKKWREEEDNDADGMNFNELMRMMLRR